MGLRGKGRGRGRGFRDCLGLLFVVGVGVRIDRLPGGLMVGRERWIGSCRGVGANRFPGGVLHFRAGDVEVLRIERLSGLVLRLRGF